MATPRDAFEKDHLGPGQRCLRRRSTACVQIRRPPTARGPSGLPSDLPGRFGEETRGHDEVQGKGQGVFQRPPVKSSDEASPSSSMLPRTATRET